MEKLANKVRDIRFFSEKNGFVLTVHSSASKHYADALENDEKVSSYQTNILLENWQNKISLTGIRKAYLAHEWTSDFMSKMDIKNIDKSELVDIKTIQIDPTLPVEERMVSYLEQVKNPYCFLCGSTPVRIRFVNDKRSLTEALVTYFKTLK